MSFRVIETQEQFDEAIKDRLQRERDQFKGWLSPEAEKEKYKDYMSPEAVTKKYEGYMSKEDVDKKYAGFISPEDAAVKDKKIKEYETNALKQKVATKYGIPAELAGRLTGEDEAALEEDAKTLSQIVKSNRRTAPLRTNEKLDGAEDNDNREALKTMLSDMEMEGE